MRLRFVQGKGKTVFWSDSVDKGHPDSTDFIPEGETSDERGKRLLENPKYQGMFIEVKEETPTPKESFICDRCDFSGKTKAGLGAHKRKHKEQQ